MIWCYYKSVRTTILDAGENAEQLELSSTADGNEKMIQVLENNLAVSGEIKYTLFIWPSNLLTYVPKWNENLFSHKMSMSMFRVVLLMMNKI